MVRLKGGALICAVVSIVTFNSTMVRLKVPEPLTFNAVSTPFNSTMVRLKDEEELHVNRPLRFQFHYGTIKSPVRVSVCVPRCLFQFHYGTIKSIICITVKSGCKAFNSTMVRLKVQARQRVALQRHLSIPLWYD